MKKNFELFKPVVHVIGIFCTLWLLSINKPSDKQYKNISIQKDSLKLILVQGNNPSNSPRLVKLFKKPTKFLQGISLN